MVVVLEEWGLSFGGRIQDGGRDEISRKFSLPARGKQTVFP